MGFALADRSFVQGVWKVWEFFGKKGVVFWNFYEFFGIFWKSWVFFTNIFCVTCVFDWFLFLTGLTGFDRIFLRHFFDGKVWGIDRSSADSDELFGGPFSSGLLLGGGRGWIIFLATDWLEVRGQISDFRKRQKYFDRIRRNFRHGLTRIFLRDIFHHRETENTEGCNAPFYI